MRAIAEEAFEMIRRYKGSHSGEHGDGLLRSEFHAAMFGAHIVRSFEEIKDAFDPLGLFNPDRIVHAPKFDNRSLFRYGPNYEPIDHLVRLDWSRYSGKSGGFQGAVEMCNNNGLCRKLEGGTMCPSYRVTRSEKDVTRGRANTLRLALSGQLGANAFTSDDILGAMELCVSCKACRKECPTGVDMARMKIEVLAARADRYGISIRDRLIGWMPRYAPYAASFPWLLNLRDRLPGLAELSEKLVGLSADRRLPRWRRDIFSDHPNTYGAACGTEVVLFVDTFNRYFEPENIEAAIGVLVTAGYRVHVAVPPPMDRRPLCCGRTFLSVGQVGEAKREAKRALAALGPFADRGMPLICLEPSCLFSFRDEIPAYLPGDCTREISNRAVTFEEFLACEARAGRLNLPLAKLPERKALLHGHCHQKSFSVLKFAEETLNLVPGLEVEVLDSGCCGMAGAFGYRADTISVSRSMGELALLPAVRCADANTLIVADGISCRQQIRDGTFRTPMHVAAVLFKSIKCLRDLHHCCDATFEQ